MTRNATAPGAATLVAALLLFLAPDAAGQQVVLVEDGTPMSYLSNSSDPGLGLDWTADVFDDSGWTRGVYGVGYDEDIGLTRAEALTRTEVPPGAWSIYTRTTFDLSDPALVENLHVGCDCDDGWVAWINGTQVYCSPEMTSCTPEWNRGPFPHESSNGAYPDYGTLQDVSAAALGVLRAGDNVLAIGVWNATGGGDLVLSPQLVMNVPSVAVTRGPYLQQTTPTGTIVRWRTDADTDSLVRYRPTGGGAMQSAGTTTLTSEHEVLLDGLTADTEYEYAVGSSTELFVGLDGRHQFSTPAATGTRQPYRLWVIGDSGTASANAGIVRQTYEELPDGGSTDVWLMLGDNAYENGTEEEYQRAVFGSYPRQLRTTALWPTFGNHDGVNSFSADESGPYYDAFTLPTAAEAGGVASGTEAYYSFDVGNIHFVSLNSQDVDRTPSGDMLLWLDQDLAQVTADWTIAFWHHPPYSKGSHDSDNAADSGGRLFDMRGHAMPILESWGVDLVLTGHSHSYERSVLVDGHHGTSDTLTPEMKLDEGDGRLDGDGAYEKPSAGPAANEGAIHIVAGNAGRLAGGALNHPVMKVSLNVLGSVVLDVEGDRLRGRLLGDNGQLWDRFTLVKNTGLAPAADFAGSPVSGPTPLTVAFEDRSTTNNASWAWDFDADAIVDSVEIDPVHVYAAPGEYTVRLDVANAAGADFAVKADYVCASNGDPDVVDGLLVAGDKQSLSWNPFRGTASFDTVKGDLLALRSGAGDFTGSVLACLENDGSDETAIDTESPPTGSGFYYLVRRASCASTPGSYDSGGAGQQAARDAAIDASTQSCD